MSNFDQFAFNADPSFDEAQIHEVFSYAVPLKTLVIYCYDPRAADIPKAAAQLFGNEVFPGEVILDTSGKRVASTATILPVIVAGGRAIDALRSITSRSICLALRTSWWCTIPIAVRLPSQPTALSMLINVSSMSTSLMSMTEGVSTLKIMKRR